MSRIKNKYIIYFIGLLVIVSLSVGFSALQKQLFVSDINMNVRLHQDVRVSNISLSSSAGDAITNSEDFNKEKLYGNITFPTTSSYVLYKVDLTNYGNVKSGLLNITNNSSGINYQICNSSGSNCTNEIETPVCNGSNCTLGSTKEIYLKISSTSSGTKNVDLDFDFEPYNNVTYTYFQDNTESFKKEIMSNDTYTVTIASKPEEIELSGTATINYNKNTGVLTISNIESDIELHAKYLVNTVAETSYSGSNPDNYVRFNDTLYRIVTKGNIDDGYGNEELRTKIISNSSIGKNKFDNESNNFSVSSLANILNTTYYDSLNNDAKELIDTVKWVDNFTEYVGLINKNDAENNIDWLQYLQFTLTPYGELIGSAHNNNSYKTLKMKMDNIVGSSENNIRPMAADSPNVYSVHNNNSLGFASIDVSFDTYPSVYLKENALIVGGSGTSSNPYILELANGGLQSNPTSIKGRTLTVTGSNQELVTVSNKVGTPYYSTSTQLNENNYTSGSTSVPTNKNVGSYTIYYYIPAGEGYKAKSGSVRTTIKGITYTITYEKGSNITSVGKSSDTCTTSGSSLTCAVTLPSITPASGWENGKWYNGSNSYNPGSSYTLSTNGVVLTAQVTGKTYTANIYYYNGSGVANVEKSCTVSEGSTCNIVLPSTVTSSKGVYNSSYIGLASAINTMNTSSLSISGSGNCYAVYSEEVTNYDYNSGYKTRTLYRNEYFTSNSALTVKLSTENNSVQNYGTSAGPGSSSWLGLSTGQDTTVEYNTVEEAASSTSKTLYTVYSFSVDYQKGSNVSSIGLTGDTCKVTTNNTSCSVVLPSITPNTGYDSVGWSVTSGSTTGVASGQNYTLTANPTVLYANAKGSTYTATFYYYNGTGIATKTSSCTVSSGSTCTVSVPSEVSSSTGKYGSTYKGVTLYTSSMNTSALTIGNNTTKFYAIYSKNVTRYYYSSGYKSNTIYRNEYFTNDTTITSVLSTVDNGTTNYTSSKGPGSSNWLGLSTAKDTTPEYSSVQLAANSTSTTLYTVYQFVINYEKSVNVSEIGATSATCNVTTSDTLCGVILPSITPNTGYISVGWNTTNGATTGSDPLTIYSISSNNQTLYANAVESIYQNTTTNNYYVTLTDALNSVNSNETIKVLKSTTESQTATLASGKTGIVLDLNGKTITTSAENGIENNGTLTIINGTINAGQTGILNNSTGQLIINDSSTKIYGNTAITNNGSLVVNNGELLGDCAIINNGTAEINGGSFTGTSSAAVINYGSTTITNGELNGVYGISIDSSGTNYGSATILGGTIMGSVYGINIKSGTTLTLGSNDSTVSTTVPDVQKIDTGSGYGIYNEGGTFNFYDGIIKARNVSGVETLNSNPTNVPTGYSVNKEVINNVKNAYLIKPYYQNTTTNIYYESLNDAFSNVSNNQTIKALQNVTESTNAILTSGKTGIKLDLNGKTITLNNNYINNNGSLDIYNSSSDDGIITGYSDQIILNNGVLKINETSSTNKTIIENTISSTATVIKNNDSKSLTINKNSEIKITTIEGTSVILNYGSISILGGTISNGYIGINNETSGTLTVSGSDTAVSGYENGIINKGDATINSGTIQGSPSIINQPNSTLRILNSSVLIKGVRDTGIQNYGNLIVDGASFNIPADNYAITNMSETIGDNTYNGVTNVVSGTLYSNHHGIYAGDGTLNIGENDGIVNANSPVIDCTQNSNSIGVAKSTSGIVNFYDGYIKAKIGYGYFAISETPDGLPDGYSVFKETNSNIQTAYLSYYYINTSTNKPYRTLNEALGEVQSNQTIRAENNMSGTSNELIGILASDKTGVKLDLNGKTITSNASLFISNSGTLDIYNSSSTPATVNVDNRFLSNSGTLTMNGTSSTNQLIINFNSSSESLERISNSTTGFLTIYNNVNINDFSNLGIVNQNNLTILGGTINSTRTAIKNDSGATLTLGINDSTVSTATPLIQTTGTNNSYGIDNLGTLKFYDGIVKSSSGSGKSINGTVSEVTANYKLYKETNDGIESAYLVKPYKVLFDNQSATTTGTSEAWYVHNQSNVVGGVTCYYYSDSNLSTCLTDGNKITIPTKTGYTFDGYYSEINGSGTQYVDSTGLIINDLYKKLPNEINSSYTDTITLYAKWTANTYELRNYIKGFKDIMATNQLTTNSTTLTMDYTDGEYTIAVPAESYSGVYIPDSLFTVSNKYILMYDIQKVSGTFTKIGGHSSAGTQSSFTVDGVNAGSYYSSYNLNNDTNIHRVIYTFTYNGSGSPAHIYIQPNRGEATAVTVKITNLKLLVEGSDYNYIEKKTNKEYNTNYTSADLQVPSIPGYTYDGWYVDSTYATKLTTSDVFNNLTAQFYDINTINTGANIHGRIIPNEYSLTVNPNGGLISGKTASYSLTKESNSQIAIPKPTRIGHTFNGWTMSGSGSLSKYGVGLYNDDGFNSGNNSLEVYNNTGNGNVTHARIATTTDNPMKDSSYVIKITNSGTSSPGLGGFYQYTASRANAVFYHVIVAKIPVGYTIINAQNATGDGRHIEWLTSQKGTGKYETYIYRHTCGSSGTFSTFGHVYLSGTVGSSSNPVVWYVAYANVFDYSANSSAIDGQVFTFGSSNTSLTADWTANQYSITYNANGGSGAPSATTYTYATSGNVTLSSTVPTLSGYHFAGWSTSSTATTIQYASGASFPKNTVGNTTLYAVWYRWSSGNGYFKTLTSAISGTSSGGTIKLFDSHTDNTTINVGKTLTMNLNGGTLTRDRTITVDSGGKLTISGGTLTTTSGVPLTNNGTLTLSGGTFTTSANNNVVTNSGTLSVSGATITQSKGYSAVINSSSMTFSSGTIQNTSGVLDKAAVENRSSFTLNGGTIKATGNAIGIWHPSGYSQTTTITSGTITGGSNNAIWIQTGTVNANGGSISGSTTTYHLISNSGGTLNVDGATITQNSSGRAIGNNSGTTTITQSSGRTTTIKKKYKYYCHNCSSNNDNTIVGSTTGNMYIKGGTITYESGYTGGTAVAVGGGTTTMSGGTITTYSDSTYYGRTVYIGAGTFNYSGGTINYGSSNSNAFQVWRIGGTFNNTSGKSVSYKNDA